MHDVQRYDAQKIIFLNLIITQFDNKFMSF